MAGDDERLIELRRLLAPAIGDVSGLVSEARREADNRVRGLLVQAFTDALLERVGEQLSSAPARPAVPMSRSTSPTSPPAPPAARPAPAAAGGEPRATPAAREPEPAALGWYVYCVLGAEHPGVPDNLEGIDAAHPVRSLPADDLTAVVSRVSLADFGEEPLREHLADLAWLERTARRHEHVLEEVARGGTPIPMRLCTIYRDEGGVLEMLIRETVGLHEALAHLAGKAEWGVKAFADLDAIPSPAEPDPTAAHTGEGATYLHGRLAQRRDRERAQRRLDEACEAIHTTLGRVSEAGVISPPQRAEVSGRQLPMIFNASYLVPDDEDDAFHQALARLGSEFAPLRIELESTGPWPPYNFVPGVIGAAW